MSWSVFGVVGFGAVAVVVVGWLVISFTRAGARRTQLEWLSSCALYVALLSLFSSLLSRAAGGDNTFAMVAFGFLVALFGAGLLVALYELLRSFGGSGTSASSATN